MDRCIDEVKVLAIDFGASSGRAMIVSYKDEKLTLREVHRFANEPVLLHKTLYWDFLRLMQEVKTALCKVKEVQIQSIGIDTWGVDYGLLDSDGRLLSNPIHYRDARTKGMLEQCFEQMNPKRLYELTGNQLMEINTVFQLLAAKKESKEQLDYADTLLLMPDLMNYFLTGEKKTEFTIAATTQMLDLKEKEWSKELLSKLSIKSSMLTPIIASGTKVGYVSEQLQEELGIAKTLVTAVAGHDTQCAIAAVPASEEDFIFISCGTWSLVGTERKEPIINDQSFTYNITNEGAYSNRYSFLKNITGLWIIQECKRQFEREGKVFSYSELEELAQRATPFQAWIDVDAPEFATVGNMPERIRLYCQKTNQKVPNTVGELIRCINESLALKYRKAIEEISDCTRTEYHTIYMVGGGIQSEFLCQCTANACKRPVCAGPQEATIYGNAMIQLIALEIVEDLQAARNMVRSSCGVKYYEALEQEEWEKAYQKYLQILRM